MLLDLQAWIFVRGNVFTHQNLEFSEPMLLDFRNLELILGANALRFPNPDFVRANALRFPNPDFVRANGLRPPNLEFFRESMLLNLQT